MTAEAGARPPATLIALLALLWLAGCSFQGSAPLPAPNAPAAGANRPGTAAASMAACQTPSLVNPYARSLAAPGLGGTGVSPADPGGIGGTGRTAQRPGLGGTGATAAATPGGMGGTGQVAQRAPAAAGGGVAALEPGGMGGTGIVGVVSGFSSVCVNGVRVTYDADTPVVRDGVASGAGDLAVGQLVALQAVGPDSGLRASRITVLDAVVGPVTALDRSRARLQVMGQTAWALDPSDLEGLGVGQWVRVSGQRLANGELRASRIEPAPAGQASASGPAQRTGAGALNLAGTAVTLRDARLPDGWQEGQETQVLGRWEQGRLVASEVRGQPTRRALGSVASVLLQTYVHQLQGEQLQTGWGTVTLRPGVPVVGGSRDALQPGQPVLLRGVFDGQQRLRVELLELRDEGRRGSSEPVAPAAQAAPTTPGAAAVNDAGLSGSGSSNSSTSGRSSGSEESGRGRGRGRGESDSASGNAGRSGDSGQGRGRGRGGDGSSSGSGSSGSGSGSSGSGSSGSGSSGSGSGSSGSGSSGSGSGSASGSGSSGSGSGSSGSSGSGSSGTGSSGASGASGSGSSGSGSSGNASSGSRSGGDSGQGRGRGRSGRD